jgi:glycosyltransferase involved in cell wall biosynthesis
MTRARPTVSIGIPVYNGERYLAETVHAFLHQTYEDFELVICDNASTDGTERIGRDLAALDSRVRYERNAVNIGSARNYRRAFELTHGKYFRWNAADDLPARDALACAVDILDHHPDVVLAYPRTRFIDEHGNELEDYDDGLHAMHDRPGDRFIHVLTNIGYCNAIYGLIRADVLRRTRLLGTFIGSDVCFHAELSLYGKFFEIPERQFFRRFHAEASSSLSTSALQQFYNPGRSRGLYLREWRHLLENSRSVLRAPIRPMEKARTLSRLARIAVRSRDAFAREIGLAARHLLGRSAA